MAKSKSEAHTTYEVWSNGCADYSNIETFYEASNTAKALKEIDSEADVCIYKVTAELAARAENEVKIIKEK